VDRAGFTPEGLAAQNKRRANGRKPGGMDFFKRKHPLLCAPFDERLSQKEII
jgi:hypothetical protein